MPPKKKLTAREVADKYGFRSIALEAKVAMQLADHYETTVDLVKSLMYENTKFKFVQPAKNRKYTPDFELHNGIFIECKGRFLLADRQKHLWVREAYPELDIRFVFTDPKMPIRKGAKTTYADWCDKFNFKYAKGTIPDEWFN